MFKNTYIKLVSKINILFVILLFCAGIANARTEWPKFVPSKDGTPISFETYGKGEPTLVFVHGWSCDSRYWREQLEFFSKNNRIVLIDLAGHGHSGTNRSKYTMTAFGEDVQSVVEAIGSKNVILIGHSMGGVVIAEAARLMPDRVKGLIGIDTLENVEYPLTKEALEQMLAPFKNDFQTGSRQFVSEMLLPGTDSQLREWILSDMSSAPPSIALSSLTEILTLSVTGQLAKLFDKIKVPVKVINADMWPVNCEANRRHMVSFDATIIKGADHFLMLNKPKEFNPALENTIRSILSPITEIKGKAGKK